MFHGRIGMYMRLVKREIWHVFTTLSPVIHHSHTGILQLFHHRYNQIHVWIAKYLVKGQKNPEFD